MIRETVRDTIVRIQADSSMLRALVECDSLGQVRMRELLEYHAGERVRPPKVTIRDNVLTASAEVDSISVYMTLKDRYESHRGVTETIVTQIVEVNRLTWWQQLWIGIGKSIALGLVILAAYKLFKSKISTLWQTIKRRLKRN